jgi:hypothetical protein
MTERRPGGTVTFLFSDIEGSTRLLQELGVQRYRGALALLGRGPGDTILPDGHVGCVRHG